MFCWPACWPASRWACVKISRCSRHMRISISSAASCCSCSECIIASFPPQRPTRLAKLQGWLHIVGGILFPAGVAVVVLEGPAFIASADRGIAGGGRGNRAVRADCFPDLADVSRVPYLPSEREGEGAPSLFNPIRGIVREIDSSARNRAQTHEKTWLNLEISCKKQTLERPLRRPRNRRGVPRSRSPRAAPAPRPTTPRPTSRCSKASSRCAAAPACISAAPTKRRCIICSPK